MAPSRDSVRAECLGAGDYLLIEDTTSLDFSTHQALTDVGWIGDGRGRGLMVHSTLATRIEGWDCHRPRVSVVGLYDQQVWTRQVPPGRIRRERKRQRFERGRESQRWARSFGEAEALGTGCRWTYVADRESDIYEVLNERVGWMDYIIRSNQPRALVGQEDNIRTAVARSQQLCEIELRLRARPGHKARVAKLEVRACLVELRPPWRPGGSPPSHTTWVVEAREVKAPKNVDELHWLLLTSWDCSSAEGALKVLGAYTCRWLIEEYHKALKSGTRVESAQLQTLDRTKNLLAILALLAVRLLKAKLEPEGRVEDGAFDNDLIAVLSRVTKPPPEGWTNRTVLRAIARQGGFLARKSDGEPGWITIWRGLQHLTDMLAGYRLAKQQCG